MGWGWSSIPPRITLRLQPHPGLGLGKERGAMLYPSS